jgi:transcriptional regulator with XRE-family HTH domain
MTMTEQLRRAIRGSGLSLNQLGQRAGISHTVLSRFVRGVRTLTLPAVEALCGVLGLGLVPVNGAVAAQPHGQPQPERGANAPSSGRPRGRHRKAPAAAVFHGTRARGEARGGADRKAKGTRKGRKKP